MRAFMNFAKDIFPSNMVDGAEDYKIWIYWIHICDAKGIINVYWSEAFWKQWIILYVEFILEYSLLNSKLLWTLNFSKDTTFWRHWV